MEFYETGNMSGKTLMLLPGTCMNYQVNFKTVINRLAEKYHLICVNYDGFDGTDVIFPDMITVTEKIEKYIQENHYGRVDGALGSSLGSSFVGQLIMRENIHIDHGIFGSPDLDQSSVFCHDLGSFSLELLQFSLDLRLLFLVSADLLGSQPLDLRLLVCPCSSNGILVGASTGANSLALEVYVTGGNVIQLDDGTAGGSLTTAGLTYEAEGFTLMNLKAYVIDGLQILAAQAKILAQVVHFQ